MVKSFLFLLAGVVLTQRVSELLLANKNRKWALARGGKEFAKDHYPYLVLFHALWFLGWLGESLHRGPHLGFAWELWFFLFLLAQGLRYWAIASLGRFWNTRILVIPGQARIRTGPYRFIPHPNYLAVALEIASLPLIFGAFWTALAGGIVNAMLLLGLRIPAENRALRNPPV